MARDYHDQSDALGGSSAVLKYAHLERERRFLLPKQTFCITAARTLFIQDRYLVGSTLRLRRVEEIGQTPLFKLGQKTRLNSNSPSVIAHTTMYLTEAEFETLSTLPAKTLEKTRLLLPFGEMTLAIDEFSGQLAGLTLAEVDLGVAGSMPESLPIEWRTRSQTMSDSRGVRLRTRQVMISVSYSLFTKPNERSVDDSSTPWGILAIMSKRLELLRAKREAIIEIAARHKAFNVAVFGSVARGEDTDASDVDFLVDFLPGASLVDEFRLENELRDFLKMPVDLVSRGGLKPRDTHIREESLAI